MSRHGPVASAVIRSAQIRATLDQRSRATNSRLRRIVTQGLWVAPRVARQTELCLCFWWIPTRIPVATASPAKPASVRCTGFPGLIKIHPPVPYSLTTTGVQVALAQPVPTSRACCPRTPVTVPTGPLPLTDLKVILNWFPFIDPSTWLMPLMSVNHIIP